MTDDNDSQKYALHSKLATSILKPGLMANTLMSYLYYSNISKSISVNDFDKGFLKCSALLFHKKM